MATEFKLDPRDLAVHEGPEWVLFDRDAIDDLTFGELNGYEREMGISIAELLGVEFPRASALGVKGVVWLARKMAGLDDNFATFDIRTRRVRHRSAGVDASPPVQGSSEPSPES